MNKCSNLSILFFSIIVLSVVLSNNDKLKPTPLASKDYMDAQRKTIGNMQSAYKVDVNAIAKYEAFSKRAEENGYKTIVVFYNGISNL